MKKLLQRSVGVRIGLSGRWEVLLIGADGVERLVSSRCKRENGAMRIADMLSRIHHVPIFRLKDKSRIANAREQKIHDALE